MAFVKATQASAVTNLFSAPLLCLSMEASVRVPVRTFVMSINKKFTSARPITALMDNDAEWRRRGGKPHFGTSAYKMTPETAVESAHKSAVV